MKFVSFKKWNDEEEEFKKPPIEDLEPYTYNYYTQVKKNVLGVGWLDETRPFNKGEVPEEFIEKLKKAKRVNFTKGWHDCPFCGKAKGSHEIMVRYNNKIYMAPELIVHYIEEHNYQPPEEYINAVLNNEEE